MINILNKYDDAYILVLCKLDVTSVIQKSNIYSERHLNKRSMND